MHIHSQYPERSHHSLFAFAVGAFLALAIGGYIFFGPEGANNRRKFDRWLRRARYEILTRMEQIEDVTEEQYQKIVDEVLYRRNQLRTIGKEALDRAREQFRGRYLEMKDAVRRAAEEAHTELEEEEGEDSEGREGARM